VLGRPKKGEVPAEVWERSETKKKPFCAKGKKKTGCVVFTRFERGREQLITEVGRKSGGENLRGVVTNATKSRDQGKL